MIYVLTVCRCLSPKNTDGEDGDAEEYEQDDEKDGGSEHKGEGEGDGEEDADDTWDTDDKRGWWDEEDPDAPWMTQSTRLMPSTTIALWQFTPSVASFACLEACR